MVHRLGVAAGVHAAVWYYLTVLPDCTAAGDGSRYRVLVRSADTGGKSFTVEVLTRAGIPGFLPDLSGSTPAHNHTQGQEEQLTVISGKLGYILGKGASTGELGPGQTFTIPAGGWIPC